MVTRWRDRAACASPNVRAEIFFPLSTADRATIALARAVCAPCPVRRECLADAVRNGDDGIRGGLMESERRDQSRLAAQAKQADRAHARWIHGTAWIQDAGLAALDDADGQGFLAAGLRTEVKRALVRSGLALEGQPTSSARGRSTLRLSPAGRALVAQRRARPETTTQRQAHWAPLGATTPVSHAPLVAGLTTNECGASQ